MPISARMCLFFSFIHVHTPYSVYVFCLVGYIPRYVASAGKPINHDNCYVILHLMCSQRPLTRLHDLPDGIFGHLLQEVLLMHPPLHHCSRVDELAAVGLIAIVLCIGNGLVARRRDVVSHCRDAIDLHSQALVWGQKIQALV